MREIVKRRSAGEDHAVLTVEGTGPDPYRREPCATCPWRKDAVGEFPAEAFRLTANIGVDPAFLPWRTDPILAADLLAKSGHQFACHESGAGRPATCAGFILRGDQALAWRVGVIKGLFNVSEVSDGGHALFQNYRAMAEANGVAPDDPALIGCSPVKP